MINENNSNLILDDSCISADTINDKLQNKKEVDKITITNSLIKGNLNISSCTVNNDVNLNNTIIKGELKLEQVHIKGQLLLNNMHINGGLKIYSVNVLDIFLMKKTIVDDQVQIYFSRFHKYSNFYNSDFKKTVDLKDNNFYSELHIKKIKLNSNYKHSSLLRTAAKNSTGELFNEKPDELLFKYKQRQVKEKYMLDNSKCSFINKLKYLGNKIFNGYLLGFFCRIRRIIFSIILISALLTLFRINLYPEIQGSYRVLLNYLGSTTFTTVFDKSSRIIHSFEIVFSFYKAAAITIIITILFRRNYR